MNKITISGRLTRDTEVKSDKLATNCVAVDEGYGQNKTTQFFNLKFLGEKKVDFATKYLSKGKGVLIEGKLDISSWTDNEGKKRTDTSIIVNDIEFFGGNKEEKSEVKTTPVDTVPEFMNVSEDAELPFL